LSRSSTCSTTRSLSRWESSSAESAKIEGFLQWLGSEPGIFRFSFISSSLYRWATRNFVAIWPQRLWSVGRFEAPSNFGPINSLFFRTYTDSDIFLCVVPAPFENKWFGLQTWFIFGWLN
jgi:hypothetical protein